MKKAEAFERQSPPFPQKVRKGWGALKSFVIECSGHDESFSIAVVELVEMSPPKARSLKFGAPFFCPEDT